MTHPLREAHRFPSDIAGRTRCPRPARGCHRSSHARRNKTHRNGEGRWKTPSTHSQRDPVYRRSPRTIRKTHESRATQLSPVPGRETGARASRVSLHQQKDPKRK